MGGNWKEYNITELYKISSGLSKPAKDFGEGFPFLAFKDVFYNWFLPKKLNSLVKSNDKERNACSIKRGDVFLTRTSETMDELGMSSIARKDYPNATFNGFCKRLRPFTDIPIYPEYVGYFLRSPQFRNTLTAFSTMSTRASLNNGMIGSLKIILPPFQEQKAIAHILGSLDDKIELNRQMNATLKGMAQALFKSWFVDFDPVIDNALAAGNPIPEAFAARAQTRRKALAHGTANRDIAKQFPTAFQFTEEMRWIPEGWEVKQIKEFGKIICGKTPSKKNEKYYGKDVPFIKIPDMHNNVWITEAIDSLSFEGAKSQQKKEIPPNSICVSCIATVGKVSITSAISHTNQQINSVVPNHSCSTYYLYFSFSGMGKKLIDLASGGSATLNLNTGDFSKIDIISPPTELLSGYHETIKKLFNKILSSEYQSKSLANLRDTLLPKLISGEIRIPEAEKLTEKALA